MCEWGTTIPVLVKITASRSHTGKDYWDYREIDSCIAPIVKALQQGNIDMLGSCCGHGKAAGQILLADGRILEIKKKRRVSYGLDQGADCL